MKKTATGRDKLLSTLLAGIEQKTRQSKHQLLIGPWGIGKSHIIALLHYKIKSSSRLMAKWLPVFFPDEAAEIIFDRRNCLAFNLRNLSKYNVIFYLLN